jgi:hypothetical protein
MAKAMLKACISAAIMWSEPGRPARGGNAPTDVGVPTRADGRAFALQTFRL